MRVIYIVSILLLIILAIPFVVIGGLLDKDKAFKSLIALDQLFAVIIFGAEDITISSLLYYYTIIKEKKWARYAMRFVDFLAFIIARQKKHCEKSFYNEQREFASYINKYNTKKGGKTL